MSVYVLGLALVTAGVASLAGQLAKPSSAEQTPRPPFCCGDTSSSNVVVFNPTGGPITDFSLCNNPPRLKDTRCVEPGAACQNSAQHEAALSTCRIKVYFKAPNNPVEVLAGTCSGVLVQYFYRDPNLPNYAEVGGVPRHDIVLTARHCIDSIYDACLRRAIDDNPDIPRPGEPPLPGNMCFFRAEVEFGARYAAPCFCGPMDAPNPPCAMRCGTPNRGTAPDGADPGSPGSPDPTMPCLDPIVWQARRVGLDFYDLTGAPCPAADCPPNGIPDLRNGNCDWAVLKLTPNPGNLLPFNFNIPGIPLGFFIDPEGPAVPSGIPVEEAEPDVFITQHPRGRCQEVAEGRATAFELPCILRHTVDTEAGSSGSPVVYEWQFNPDLRVIRVVGIHAAGGCPTRGFNVAVDMLRLFAPLQPGTPIMGINRLGRRSLDWAILMADAPAGDLNLDHFVDATDLLIFLDAYGSEGCDDRRYYRLADFNCDGKIDLVDYQYWFAAYQAANPNPPI